MLMGKCNAQSAEPLTHNTEVHNAVSVDFNKRIAQKSVATLSTLQKTSHIFSVVNFKCPSS